MTPAIERCSVDRSRHLLASVWQRSLPLVRARLDRLHEASQRCDIGLLTAEARAEASDIAHKLAGSLGMFGYSRGTEIAREIELLVDGDAPVSVQRFELLVGRLSAVLPL